MRILVVTGLYPPEGGGPATHTKMMETHLPDHGFAVDVLPFRVVRKFPVGVRHLIFFIHCMRMARRVDLVFAQDTVSVGFPARVAAFLLRKKFVVRVPGDHVWEQGRARFGVTSTLDDFPVYPRHPYLLALRLVQRITLWGAWVIVPSDYLRRIVEMWGVPHQRVTRIYNGIDFSIPTERPEETIMRPCILSVARLVSWKGLKELIDVLPGHLSWHLYLLGNGPEREALVAHAQERGVYEGVHFLGELENASARGWMEAADVCVLNSTYEGFSHVLVEMLHAGKVVVATDLPGNREAAGACAHYVQPGKNTQELSDVLGRIIANGPDDTEHINAHTHVTQFSVEKTAEQLGQYLKHL